MTRRYAHQGGDVIDGLGRPLAFALIPHIIREWSLAALDCAERGHDNLARAYARPCLDLVIAYAEAQRWRKASGGLSTLEVEHLLEGA